MHITLKVQKSLAVLVIVVVTSFRTNLGTICNGSSFRPISSDNYGVCMSVIGVWSRATFYRTSLLYTPYV